MNPYYFLALLSVALSAVSQTILKKSAQKHWESRLREYLNVYVITGYGMLGCSLILMLICYKNLGYMQSVIMEPLAYILVLILGRAVFGELLTSRKILGMLLIIAGVVVFNVF